MYSRGKIFALARSGCNDLGDGNGWATKKLPNLESSKHRYYNARYFDPQRREEYFQ
jgi:hypothetical protein